jgi:hypothetical protein
MRAASLLATTALLIAAPAAAQDRTGAFLTGADLLARCQGATVSGDCIMYVAGALDAAMAMEAALRGMGQNVRTFCLPSNATPRAAAEVVAKYLAFHPEIAQSTAASAVHAAVVDAYPCGSAR